MTAQEKDIRAEISPEWLTISEVASHYRVSHRTILRWTHSDPTMAVRRIGPGGRIIRIHRSELNRMSDLPVPA
jgi:excisionase family DNA binding protein